MNCGELLHVGNRGKLLHVTQRGGNYYLDKFFSEILAFNCSQLILSMAKALWIYWLSEPINLSA